MRSDVSIGTIATPEIASRTGGIMVMSVGVGLTMLLWFVGVPRIGIGIGGFLAIIGIGLLVNSLFYSPPPIPPPPPPSAPTQSWLIRANPPITYLKSTAVRSH
jgi:hypothetical protein